MVLTPKRLTSPHCRKGCSGIFTYLVKIKYQNTEKEKMFQVIQGMASCTFSRCLLIRREREPSGRAASDCEVRTQSALLLLVTSSADGTAQGNTVRRRETKLRLDNALSKPWDQKRPED